MNGVSTNTLDLWRYSSMEDRPSIDSSLVDQAIGFLGSQAKVTCISEFLFCSGFLFGLSRMARPGGGDSKYEVELLVFGASIVEKWSSL